MLPQSSYTIKARTWPILLICSLVGVPAILLIVLEPENKGGPYLFLAAVLLALLLYAMSRSLQIILDNEQLSFHAYGRKKSMKWTDVKASNIHWSVEGGHTASFNWTFQSYSNKEIHIALGYYSRSDMTLLANQTIEKAKNAHISVAVYKVANGQFPWYLI